MTRQFLAKLALPFTFTLAALALNAHAAPETPIDDTLTIVVGFQPGGASDRGARIVAEQLQKKTGINVVVENKTGAGGRVAAQYVKSQGDRKDILMLGNPAIIAVAPIVYKNLPYDSYKDFQPVAMVSKYGFGVAVSGDSPLKTLNDLLEWAKKNPKEFNVGVPATGSLPHFFALMLAEKTGVDVQVIGYRGSAPSITDLIGGALVISIDTLDVLIRQHKGDRIRILATSGTERDPELPDVGTFMEQGVELTGSGWNALFAPSSMSEEKVAFLGKTIKEIMAQEDVQKTLLQNDLIPVVADAEGTAEIIKDFRAQWDSVVKDSGYVVDR